MKSSRLLTEIEEWKIRRNLLQWPPARVGEMTEGGLIDLSELVTVLYLAAKWRDRLPERCQVTWILPWAQKFDCLLWQGNTSVWVSFIGFMYIAPARESNVTNLPGEHHCSLLLIKHNIQRYVWPVLWLMQCSIAIKGKLQSSFHCQ